MVQVFSFPFCQIILKELDDAGFTVTIIKIDLLREIQLFIRITPCLIASEVKYLPQSVYSEGREELRKSIGADKGQDSPDHVLLHKNNTKSSFVLIDGDEVIVEFVDDQDQGSNTEEEYYKNL